MIRTEKQKPGLIARGPWPIQNRGRCLTWNSKDEESRMDEARERTVALISFVVLLLLFQITNHDRSFVAGQGGEGGEGGGKGGIGGERKKEGRYGTVWYGT